jgi:hypothetical protein
MCAKAHKSYLRCNNCRQYSLQPPITARPKKLNSSNSHYQGSAPMSILYIHQHLLTPHTECRLLSRNVHAFLAVAYSSPPMRAHAHHCFEGFPSTGIALCCSGTTSVRRSVERQVML